VPAGKILTALLLLLPALLGAQSYAVPRAPGPIVIDGRIDEAAWSQALVIDRFYEIEPGDNTPPPVKTTAYLAYDHENFYMAFKCADPHPDQIRARYADRDSVGPDDFVGVILDPFHDKRYGLEFFVNPMGVQMDLSRSEPGNEDTAWDTIWTSAGRITPDGYEAEIAIPFKSLRFPDVPVQEWGFLLLRIYPRNFRGQFASSPYDKDKNCTLCQVPVLTGMEGVRPGRNVELVPTLTAMRDEQRDDPSVPMTKPDTHVEGGLTGTWGITPNLTLNAALNPDFSQVEADTEQIAVNTRFALFYPEKRSFFMEGSDYFTTPLQAVYSRTVADPSWGAKFTGKEGGDAFGVFFSRDAQANFLIPSNQDSQMFTWDHPVEDGVFRYRRDVGNDSTLGFLATSRTGDGYFNRLYGGDGRLRLGPNDFVLFQALQSGTRVPDDPAVAGAFDGSSRTGEAWSFDYQHTTRTWQWEASYSDLGRDFRADMGFIPRVDTKTGFLYGGYTLRNDKSPLYSMLIPQVWFQWTHDHAGVLTDWQGAADLSMHLARQTNGEIIASRTMERYAGTDYFKNEIHVWINSRFNRTMTAYVEVRAGDAVDYANYRPGKGESLHLQYDVRVWRRLFVDVEGSLERLTIPRGEVYNARLYYLKALYHFSNSLFVRAIVQVMNITRDPVLYLDAVNRHERTVSSQYLLTYKVNHFTLVYLGYSDAGLEEDHVDLTRMNRTYFIKLSYAVRP
jgi:hypothetical protein